MDKGRQLRRELVGAVRQLCEKSDCWCYVTDAASWLPEDLWAPASAKLNMWKQRQLWTQLRAMLDEMAQDEYLEWNLTASPYDRGTFQELALQHPPRAHRGSCRRQPPGPLV